MGSHSYAGDKWLLFVREENGFIFTAVVTQNVIAEVQVDERTLKNHVELHLSKSDELGLEINVDEFKTLFVKTLEQRQYVDLRVEMEEENKSVKDVYLSLTYKFSPTISRKGVFHLPIVASDAPQNIVTLLASIHAMPPCPTLTEQEQREKMANESLSVAIKSSTDSTAVNNQANIQAINGAAAASQSSSDAAVTTTEVTPKLLKRRHVPTGTMRRKGPRGAKLVKK